MQMNQAMDANEMPLFAAADLQDNLMAAANDLERLQTLLSDACDTLMNGFLSVSQQLQSLRGAPMPDHVGEQVMARLGDAVTALQFQDMASQLITHTHQRLRHCTDRLAQDAFGGGDDEGEGVVELAPLRPNPVTQDEMDAGSVELF